MSAIALSPSSAPAGEQPECDMADRQRIERAAAVVLSLVEAGYEQYMPILTRLDHELKELDKSDDVLARMRRRFAA